MTAGEQLERLGLADTPQASVQQCGVVAVARVLRLHFPVRVEGLGPLDLDLKVRRTERMLELGGEIAQEVCQARGFVIETDKHQPVHRLDPHRHKPGVLAVKASGAIARLVGVDLGRAH